MKEKFFKWTVEFEVHESWVADGFDMTDERAREMLTETLPCAFDMELKARVVKSPSARAIRMAQGYEVK